MSENLLEELSILFEKLVKIYEKKEEKKDEPKTAGLVVRETGLEADAYKSSLDSQEQEPVGKLLPEILSLLGKLGYRKKEIAFALDVEILTVERWESGGKGFKIETYKAFKDFLQAVLTGRSQLPLKAADSGFVTWRYLIERQQPDSQRIWYISSSRFILAQSLAFKDAVKNLFIKARQEEEGRTAPVMVYLYSRGSETDNSLTAWTRSLLNINKQEPLCGSVIGITDDTLNWFLPGVRAIMLEKRSNEKPVPLEGYLRVQLPDNVKKELLTALDPQEKDLHTPWLSVGNKTVSRWYIHCEELYASLVERTCKNQTEDFDIHYIDFQRPQKTLEGTSEEITKLLQTEPYAGRKARVIFEPEECCTDDFLVPRHTLRDLIGTR